MGIFGKIFGSDEVIKQGTKGIISGIDKRYYTEQEQAANFSGMLKLYEPFKIAQRLLALTFCIPYMLAWMLTFLASFWVDSMETQVAILSGPVSYVVLTVAGFYFGGGAVSGFVEAAKKK